MRNKAYNDFCLVYNIEAFIEVLHRHNPNIIMNQVSNSYVLIKKIIFNSLCVGFMVNKN